MPFCCDSVHDENISTLQKNWIWLSAPDEINPRQASTCPSAHPMFIKFPHFLSSMKHQPNWPLIYLSTILYPPYLTPSPLSQLPNPIFQPKIYLLLNTIPLDLLFLTATGYLGQLYTHVYFPLSYNYKALSYNSCRFIR